MPQSPALRGTTSFVHHKAMCSSNEAVRFRDFRSGTLRAMLHGHLKRLTGWLWKAGGGTKLERQRSHSFRIASMRSVTQVNTPTAAKNPPTAGPTIKEGDENASEGTDSSSRQLAAVPSEHGYVCDSPPPPSLPWNEHSPLPFLFLLQHPRPARRRPAGRPVSCGCRRGRLQRRRLGNKRL